MNNIIHIIFIIFVLVRQRYGLFSYSPNNGAKNKPVIPTGIQSNYYEKTTNLNDESKNLFVSWCKSSNKKGRSQKDSANAPFSITKS
jgi:hypothetical protein